MQISKSIATEELWRFKRQE